MAAASDGGLAATLDGHYGGGYEARRLRQGSGALEFARTLELCERFFPRPPAVVYDIGGGPGVYACELARRGYAVTLVDATALHVEQACAAFAALPAPARAIARRGDARDLSEADASADALLLLGPLYHLTDAVERQRALAEAWRVLKPGGVLLAAGISRFASMLDGLRAKYLDDPDFVKIVEEDLRTGQHRNPTGNPAYFMDVFLHHPDEFAAEVRAAGFASVDVLAVEGPAWLIPDFDAHWNDPVRQERMLWAVRAVEREKSLLGASAHIMAVARKPA